MFQTDLWSTHWVTVFPWPVCTAEAAVLRVRHLWGCPHPGNAPRFITYWYTPSRNTPPKTPTVHCWLMSCTASSPWIIFLKRIFPPSFLHSPFLWFHILCQIDKVLRVQPNKETVFFPAIMCFSQWERKGNEMMVDVLLVLLVLLPFTVLFGYSISSWEHRRLCLVSLWQGSSRAL